ncbi:LOW QUALITY PROTEIN: serine protease 30-like [Grammomys surdaster]|uniref:LOW QUALITY PROTEIN: serine protease 30-like n=1 Tax=Grammomys surdaster TaxID=491861 RepID=UPI00109FD69F|nr:LOW QUALITY PROTEIN: serine protease 30-like [Grammomys surdaster]
MASVARGTRQLLGVRTGPVSLGIQGTDYTGVPGNPGRAEHRNHVRAGEEQPRLGLEQQKWSIDFKASRTQTPLCCGPERSHGVLDKVHLLLLQILTGGRGDILPPVCGHFRDAGKIVGGQDALEGQWPWQVSLWTVEDGHICGCSLIHEVWVLTAAHCFRRSRNPSFFHVKVGGLRLSLLEPQSTLVALRSISVYPTYLWEDASSGDIALVQLDTLLQPSQFTPVCLPGAKAPLTPGTVFWVTGWGATQERNLASVLQELAVPLLDSEKCEKMYHIRETSLSGKQVIQSDILCAGFVEGQKDSCQGDSGGPLVCAINGSWTQVGITSWGVGCARPYRPGVYTPVPVYLDWIQRTLVENHSDACGCHSQASGAYQILLPVLLAFALPGALGTVSATVLDPLLLGLETQRLRRH